MKLLKSYSDKEVKRLQPIVKKINSYEDEYKELSDDELKAKTQEFKDRLNLSLTCKKLYSFYKNRNKFLNTEIQKPHSDEL